MRFHLSAFVSLVGLSFAIIGCSSAPDGATDNNPESETVSVAVNTTCPIMGGKVTDEGGRTQWNGQTIGFCCPDCIDEWNELTEEEKTSKLAEASESSGNHDHGDHADHGSDDN